VAGLKPRPAESIQRQRPLRYLRSLLVTLRASWRTPLLAVLGFATLAGARRGPGAAPLPLDLDPSAA